MNIAEWSIKNSTITWVVTLVLAVVGTMAFNNLARLEDPEFTIKEAVVFTPYPGASAEEVEQEVTDLIERAAQQLGQLFYVESHSYRDKSIVKVKIKDQYDKDSLPQVWDELRRKVGDVQNQLPPGAGPSFVNDDFGDVFGVYFALTGEGYSAKEIYEFAKFLRRELLLVQDVKKISFYGAPQEVIYIELNRGQMAASKITPNDIFEALGARNQATSGGYMGIGTERIAVTPSGEYTSETEFRDLLISSRQNAQIQVSLGDIATIRRDYKEPLENIIRYDGKPAIGLAISTATGGNVVEMGEGLESKINELLQQIPHGLDMNVVSMQPTAVTKAIDGFLVSLVQAVVIVVLVLLFFMGLRSGLIIGGVLVVTITGTFIFMSMLDITLERISLGALIIALGMLVDNAIVVTDGMRVRIDKGEDALSAAKTVVNQTAMPLLGATAIAIAAFAAIGTSEDSTGEYTRSLYTVILISLSMSWFTAVTTTPLLCKTFLKPAKGAADDNSESGFNQKYRAFLAFAIKRRGLSIAVTLLVFAASLFGFGFVKQSFFPDSTREQFYIDVWFPEGTDISETQRRMAMIEERLMEYEGVSHLTTQIGGGSPRILLTYTPESAATNFGRILVDVDSYDSIPSLSHQVQQDLDREMLNGRANVRLFVLGPATGGKIQLRISGPDKEELRVMAEKVKTYLRQHPNVKGLRDEWDVKAKIVRPVISDTLSRQLAVDRPSIATAMMYSGEGVQAGVYREDDELLPIIARAPLEERNNLLDIDQTLAWSPTLGKYIPVGRVVTRFEVGFENAHIWRQDRVSMLRLHFDQRDGLSSELLADVKGEIESIMQIDRAKYFDDPAAASQPHTSDSIAMKFRDRLPIKDKPAYYFAWGGENEDSVKGSTAIAGSIPIFFGLMVFITILLFNSIKKTLVIWLVVPLAIVGVTLGLLSFNQPFGFMSLLGFMSLAGMLIKNAIVLVDQIGIELETDKPPIEAIIESGVSRLIPVSMAALTTILGMIPLLGDAFFVAMAVTIMFGLLVATLLTLVVVPVLYATIFRYR